jgi:hypothetical protein
MYDCRVIPFENLPIPLFFKEGFESTQKLPFEKGDKRGIQLLWLTLREGARLSQGE